RDYSVQQKLLMVVAVSVVATAFLFLLELWGISIPKEFLAKIVGTLIIIGVVSAILIAINSNMKEEKKDDKDNFFN
ncbi:MAG: hypothetical protein ABL867_03860, partial [Rickettsiales bacterium]